MPWPRIDADDHDYHYDVCLSFAGEQRQYVEQVAARLRELNVSVFYDDYEQVKLWGKDLYEHLHWVYSKAARYCILFASREYADKVWTTHERRSAQERAMREREEYLLPVLFDQVEIPGLRTTIGHLDAKRTPPQQVADFARAKLGNVERRNYLPPDPIRLYEAMRAQSAPQQRHVRSVASSFLEALIRSNMEERRLAMYLFMMSCPKGQFKDPHVEVDLVRRDLGIGPSEILATIRGMTSIGFEASIETHKGEGPDDVVHVRWEDRIQYRDPKTTRFALRRSTEVASHMLEIAFTHVCDEHVDELIETLDFSILSVPLKADES